MEIKNVVGQELLEVLNTLLQDYEAEFSILTKKKPDERGLYRLDVDLNSTDNFLLHLDGLAIGFCVKGMSNERNDIFEFYIIPSKRGMSIGREFAKNIFSRHKGLWQVRQIEGADKATNFWRQAIGEFTAGKYDEKILIDKHWGKVRTQLFTS